MFYRLSIILLFLLFLAFNLAATHLRCGQILVEQQGIGSKTVKVTVYYYTNTKGTTILFGGETDFISFGDGTRINVLEQGNQNVPDWNSNSSVYYASYSTTHTYSSYGFYTISYSEQNRNQDIVNFEFSVNTPAYLETSFNLEPNRSYSTPVSLSPLFFDAYFDFEFSLSLASTDPNGYILRYELAVPLESRNIPVKKFRMPEEFSINEFTGLVTWKNPRFQGMRFQGEYLFAIKTIQYDTTGGGLKEVGSNYRDFQVLLFDDLEREISVEDNLQLDSENRIFIEKGQNYKIKIFAFDDFVMPSFTLISTLPTENVSFIQYDSMYSNKHIRVGILTLNSTESIFRSQPYFIQIRTSFSSMYRAVYHDMIYTFFTEDVPFLSFRGPLNILDEKNELLAFPNPVTDFLVIPGIREELVDVHLFTSAGQKLPIRLTNDGEIDFRELPHAIYFVEIKNLKTKTTKVIRVKR